MDYQLQNASKRKTLKTVFYFKENSENFPNVDFEWYADYSAVA